MPLFGRADCVRDAAPACSPRGGRAPEPAHPDPSLEGERRGGWRARPLGVAGRGSPMTGGEIRGASGAASIPWRGREIAASRGRRRGPARPGCASETAKADGYSGPPEPAVSGCQAGPTALAARTHSCDALGRRPPTDHGAGRSLSPAAPRFQAGHTRSPAQSPPAAAGRGSIAESLHEVRRNPRPLPPAHRLSHAPVDCARPRKRARNQRQWPEPAAAGWRGGQPGGPIGWRRSG